MGSNLTRWPVVLLLLAQAGCGLIPSLSQPLYQDNALIVWLEPNPDGRKTAQKETGAQALTTEQLADILKGLRARKRAGLLQSLLSDAPHDPVFRDNELPTLAREIAKGLRLASAQERVSFQATRPGDTGSREKTGGAFFLDGKQLHMTLTQYRAPELTSYAEADEGFDLAYEPADATVQPQQEGASRWFGRNVPHIVVDVGRFKDLSVAGAAPAPASRAETPAPSPRRPHAAAASPAPPAPAPAPRPNPSPDPDLVDSLQRQIKELTAANQDLRARLQELQHRPDQSEKLERLRQELADARQALADTVIELNRLKSKTGGGAKGKPKNPPGR